MANEEAMTIFKKSVEHSLKNRVLDLFSISLTIPLKSMNYCKKSKLVISAMKTSKIPRRKVKTF